MKIMADTKELPGVLVVIFIAGGVLAFVIVFIFGKRQIQRFALKNQKGPHVPVGLDAKKVRQEHKLIFFSMNRCTLSKPSLVEVIP